MSEFVGRRIDVVTGGKIQEPVSIRMSGREYEVAEVLESWQDHGFGMAAPLKKNWRLRHHRNYYRVRTKEGEVFEIYLDRMRVGLRHGRPRNWYLYRKLESPARPP